MSRLVENKNDPRFGNIQKRFDKILSKFFKRGRIATLQIKDVSQGAHVHRSTFYDHYPHMDGAFSELERKNELALKELKEESENLNLENVYLKILYFISKDQEYYEAMLIRKDATPLLQITAIFKPILCKSWRNYSKELSEQIFQIFAWEFCGVICCWGMQEKFNEKKLDFYVKKLTKLI